MDCGPTYTLATRRRTPQQLQRKRMQDRAAQRLKRLEEKDRRRRVQDYLHCMQQTIKSLGEMAQSITQALEYDKPHSRRSADTGSPSLPSSAHDSSRGDWEDAQGCDNSLALSLSRGATKTTSSILPRGQVLLSRDLDRPDNGTMRASERDTCLLPNPGLSTSCLLSLAKSTAVSSEEIRVATGGHSDEPTPAVPSRFNSSVKDSVVYPSECVCVPKKHVLYFECFEYMVYESLMETHNRSPALPDIPLILLRPTLSDLLFLGEGENLVSAILNKILKVPKFPSLSELFGTYIHVYRLLRYRFFPCSETFQDLPEWLRPTDLQDNVPHPIYYDFVPFPRLKAAMILGTVEFERIEFDSLYLEQISVSWPDSKSIFIRSDNGAVTLHPDLEPHILSTENWTLGPSFAAKYPQMAPLVNIRTT